jgi:hypothetical protein
MKGVFPTSTVRSKNIYLNFQILTLKMEHVNDQSNSTSVYQQL